MFVSGAGRCPVFSFGNFELSILGAKVEKEIDALAARYPHREAILLPALHAVQHEHGHISDDLKKAVAEKVGVPLSRVFEVVTFYSMYFDKPVGKNVINVCVNMTCGLMGGESLCHYLSKKLGVEPGQTTKDARFTLLRTNECLADCDHAPMMQINERYFSSMTKEKVDQVLAEFMKKDSH